MTETAQKPANKPCVKLVGQDGNAFVILGLCRRAAKKAGWTAEQIKAFMDEATNGDYNHLLATACDWFDVN